MAISAIAMLVAENRAVHRPVDDAFIVYRYARHLGEGHGFVYNIGERVEGVTSLLWTFLVAAGVALGADAVAVGHWLGVASAALLTWLTYKYASFNTDARGRLVAALASWLLVLSPSFAVWSTSGLETPLFAACALAALIAEAHGCAASAILASAVAVLVRPEGVLVGAIVFVFQLRARRDARWKLLSLLVGYAAFLALLTFFRQRYFGAPLPNTFYAKVGGTIAWWGPYYLLTILVQILLPTALPAAYASRERYIWPGICWLGCVLITAIAVGGDGFYYCRFFVPALPVACALITRGFARAGRMQGGVSHIAAFSIPISAVWFALGTLPGLAASAGALLAWSIVPKRSDWLPKAAATLASTLLAGGLASAFNAPPKTMRQAQRLLAEPRTPLVLLRSAALSTRWAESKQARAEWEYMASASQNIVRQLDLLPPENKLLAAVGIGALGYYSNARVLDLVGLVDPMIARAEPDAASSRQLAIPGHQRTNAHYVMSRAPDYVLIPRVGTAVFEIPAIVELWNNEEFALHYRWVPNLGAYRRMPAVRPVADF